LRHYRAAKSKLAHQCQEIEVSPIVLKQIFQRQFPVGLISVCSVGEEDVTLLDRCVQCKSAIENSYSRRHVLSRMLVAVREGAILAGPQGPLWHWLLERKHHQAGRLARQRLDLRELPLQGKAQKRIVRVATRGLPKWPHFSLPPTRRGSGSVAIDEYCCSST
jgi:hypothetical protein